MKEIRIDDDERRKKLVESEIDMNVSNNEMNWNE